jgi:hypothetical protein
MKISFKKAMKQKYFSDDDIVVQSEKQSLLGTSSQSPFRVSAGEAFGKERLISATHQQYDPEAELDIDGEAPAYAVPESFEEGFKGMSMGCRVLLGVIFLTICLVLFGHNFIDAWDGDFHPDGVEGVSCVISLKSSGYDEVSSTKRLPWKYLAEPHKTQVLILRAYVVDGTPYYDVDDTNKYAIEWNINNKTYHGAVAEFMLSQLGTYKASVKVSSPYNWKWGFKSIEYVQEFQVMNKYVRREIRSLTDNDRDTFFSALRLLYSLPQAEGEQTYGEKYVSAETIAKHHLHGAARTDCDHWHDGAGILPIHMAFTLLVEQSLQAIDPSIAMPYWEYGMDPMLYENGWFNSPIFGESWFGEANPANDLHVVSAGRFSGVSVPSGASYANWSISKEGSLNPYVNAYGQMRSPWNNNPTSLIGRHNFTYGLPQFPTVPSCRTLRECYASTSLADLNFCLNGNTHGPVHILIGGAWAEGSLYDDAKYRFIQNPDRLLYFKKLWRMGYTRCPTNCTHIDSETEEALVAEQQLYNSKCRCSVPDEYIAEYGAKKMLDDIDLTAAFAPIFDAYTDDDGEDERGDDLATSSEAGAFYLSVLRLLEDPGVVGEMFSSNAAYDPTFWPLHGSMERMAALKRILFSNGDASEKAFNSTWGYPAYDPASRAAYLNGKCDWSPVKSASDLTLPTCTIYTTADADTEVRACEGHNYDDRLDFSGFLGKNDSYTVGSFYEFMHPWNDALPYTYDSFEYDYCDEVGMPFISN